MDLIGRFPPARSIPNLPNETCSMAPSNESYGLARSTSQPAEMWGRDIIPTDAEHYQSLEKIKATKAASVSISTQTENKIDLQTMEKFILSNPRLVLNILGIIEPTYHIECELQPQTLITIPEADVSSTESNSPQENNNNQFDFNVEVDNNLQQQTNILWDSPHNSNNKNTENCRSTDALLGNASDDCLKSDENLASISTTLETINFNIIREGSVKSLKNLPVECTRSEKSTSSSNSVSSESMHTPKASTADISTVRSAHIHSSSGSLKRKHSWKEPSASYVSPKSCEYKVASTECLLNEYQLESSTSNYDELNEKSALLGNDVKKSNSGRSSTSDVQKRNHLLPRPPFSYRFSAGDADKLEKGIKNIPSTRSLKES